MLQRKLESASGVSARTLQKAAQRVGIKRSRDGERGPWLWALREHTRPKNAYLSKKETDAYAKNVRLCSPADEMPPDANKPKEASTEGLFFDLEA